MVCTMTQRPPKLRVKQISPHARGNETGNPAINATPFVISRSPKKKAAAGGILLMPKSENACIHSAIMTVKNTITPHIRTL